jgi:hypothetical protein
VIIEAVRDATERTERSRDWGTNDLLMGDVLRRHEMQVWFLAEHLVDLPLVAIQARSFHYRFANVAIVDREAASVVGVAGPSPTYTNAPRADSAHAGEPRIRRA